MRKTLKIRFLCKTIDPASMKGGLNKATTGDWSQWYTLPKVDINMIKRTNCRLKQKLRIKVPKGQHYTNKKMRYEYQWDSYPPQGQTRWMWALIGNCMAFNNDKSSCMILIENTNRERVKETSIRQKNRKQPNATNGLCHQHSEIILHAVAGFSLHQDILKCIFIYDVFSKHFVFHICYAGDHRLIWF